MSNTLSDLIEYFLETEFVSNKIVFVSFDDVIRSSSNCSLILETNVTKVWTIELYLKKTLSSGTS